MASNGVRSEDAVAEKEDEIIFYLLGCIPVRILRPGDPRDSNFLWFWEVIIGIISLWYLVNVPLEIGFGHDTNLATGSSAEQPLRQFLIIFDTALT